MDGLGGIGNSTNDCSTRRHEGHHHHHHKAGEAQQGGKANEVGGGEPGDKQQGAECGKVANSTFGKQE